MSFGTQLRQARKAKQLTQKELAAKIGAAHNSISNWENDQNMPDPDTIQKLCSALDIQPNYFFFSNEDNPTPSQGQHVNTLRIAGRDGSYHIRHLTDEQLAALKAILDLMPDVPEDLT